MIKKIVLSTLLIFSIGYADDHSDEKKKVDNNDYLFGGKGSSYTHSGFGGFSISNVGGKLYSGVSGAWLVNDTFFLGLRGNGLIEEGFDDDVDGGFGGFWLGYVHNSTSSIHPVVSLTLGAAAVDCKSFSYGENGRYKDRNCEGNFFTEVNVGAEMNISPYFRIVPHIGYRHIELEDYKGLVYGVSLMFGKF